MSVLRDPEVDVLVDEVAVHRVGLDDVVGDVVQDRQVRARLEDQRRVGEVGRAVLIGRERVNAHVRRADAGGR